MIVVGLTYAVLYGGLLIAGMTGVLVGGMGMLAGK
jgi:hypothetical protein